MAASVHRLFLGRAFELQSSRSGGLLKAVISFLLCGEECFLVVIWCPTFYLRPWGWRGVIGELSIPAHHYLASVSTLKLQVPYRTCASQPRSSPSIPPILWLVSSLEEITSQPDYLLFVHVPVLYFGNDRKVWKMFIFAVLQFS